MKFRKKYTKKKYAKHTRKRKYKQKHRRTHKRKGLKKRKTTRRKGWGGRPGDADDDVDAAGNLVEELRVGAATYGDCKENIFPKNIDFMEKYTKDSHDASAGVSPGGDTLDSKPQVTNLHIIFSHKGRMQCILQDLLNKRGISEPKNGAIIVIAQRNNNREIQAEDTFYDSSQYKEGNDSDKSFIENFSIWFNTYSREEVTLFIFVRHGVGWHNLDSNKRKKWFMRKIKGNKGLNWDSSLLFDKKYLDALTRVSAPLLQELLEKINENSRNPEIIKPKLYCSDLQRTMQTAKIVLAGIDRNIIPDNDVVYILPCNHEFSCKDSEANVKESKNEKKYENVTSLPDEAWGSIPVHLTHKPLKYDMIGYLAFYNGNVRGISDYKTADNALLTQLGKTEADRLGLIPRSAVISAAGDEEEEEDVS